MRKYGPSFDVCLIRVESWYYDQIFFESSGFPRDHKPPQNQKPPKMWSFPVTDFWCQGKKVSKSLIIILYQRMILPFQVVIFIHRRGCDVTSDYADVTSHARDVYFHICHV